jgi:hypothetical protein
MPQLFHPLRNTANILGFAQILKEATSGDTRYISLDNWCVKI